MSAVAGVNHLTLMRTRAQLPAVKAFYESVIGLESGSRPGFDFDGTWLYAGTEPIVHLAAVLPEPVGGEASTTDAAIAGMLPGSRSTTGAIEHIALRAAGPVEAFRQQLRAHDIRFTEAPVPGFPLYQLFLNDPLGVKLELNFELAP